MLACICNPSSVFDIITSFATIVALLELSYQIYIRHKDEKWRQANNIACWVSSKGEATVVRVANNDSRPIYDVVVSVDDVQGYEIMKGEDRCRYCFIIPPGVYDIEVPEVDRGMNHIFNASITFRDSNGLQWHRRADGIMKCMGKKASFELRELELPVGNNPARKVT